MRSRVFDIVQQVINQNTEETLLDEDTIIDGLEHKTIKEWQYVLHDKDVYTEEDEKNNPEHKAGESKPHHWHIAINCNNRLEIETIAKWFNVPANCIHVPKGKGAGRFLDIVEYNTHEHPRQQIKGKYRYPDEEVKSNFNWRERLNHRKADKEKYGADLSEKDRMRYDVLYNGKTLRQCMAQDRLLYMEDFERLKKLRLQFISMQKPPKTRLNYYISGEGGVGKGLMSKALARSMYPQYEDDEDIFFEVGAKGAAFEEYDGQPVIIWNDRRAGELLRELNGRGNVFNVFDTHPSKQKQNIKYSSINLCNEINIVNSVDSYIEFLEGLAGNYTDRNGEEHRAEDKGQSYRRFPFIIPLHLEDFDLLINKGFMEDTNKYEEYIAYRQIIGNMQKLHSACGQNEKLLREIEQQMVKPVIEKHEEVMEKFKHSAQDEDAIRNQFKDYGKRYTETDAYKQRQERIEQQRREKRNREEEAIKQLFS